MFSSQNFFPLIVFQKSRTGINFPIKAFYNDAGIDLLSNEEFVLKPRETKIIDTGLWLAFQKGYYGKIHGKSSLDLKGCCVSNAGVVDFGYKDTLKIVIRNINSSESIVFETNTPIAQFALANADCRFSLILAESEFETVNEISPCSPIIRANIKWLGYSFGLDASDLNDQGRRIKKAKRKSISPALPDNEDDNAIEKVKKKIKKKKSENCAIKHQRQIDSDANVNAEGGESTKNIDSETKTIEKILDESSIETKTIERSIDKIVAGTLNLASASSIDEAIESVIRNCEIVYEDEPDGSISETESENDEDFEDAEDECENEIDNSEEQYQRRSSCAARDEGDVSE